MKSIYLNTKIERKRSYKKSQNVQKCEGRVEYIRKAKKEATVC